MDELTHILVVESDSALAAKLKKTLERSENLRVETVERLADVPNARSRTIPDLIVIDLSSPVIDGFEVFRVLRSRQRIAAKPVVMLKRLRSSGASEDRRPQLDEGLVGRKLSQVLNPRGRQLQPWVLARYGDDHITADFAAGQFWLDGHSLELTAREQELLRVIVEQANRVVTRREIEERLWGYPTRSVDVHIRRLRQKLDGAGGQIETVPGFGYRFVTQGTASRIPETATAARRS